MQHDDNEQQQMFIPAEGPTGLMEVLEDLLTKSKQDPEFAAQEHIILYQLGNQKSLIKVDLSQPPGKFWYNDLLGRPITKAVENTIAEFLWTKCGEKERYLQSSATRDSL